MSKLEELIAELCPDGVKSYPLSTVVKLTAGDRITKAMMLEDGKYPVMGGGILPTGYYNDYNFEKSVTISRAGSAGSVGWQENKFWATDVCFVASQKQEDINIKYIYYFLANSETELKTKIYGGNLPKLNKDYLWNLPIPVPPLEVQNEIVHILDNFTELAAELTAELTAELKARKKHYEYYKDSLLTFGDDALIVTLSHCCISIADGDHQAPPKADKGIPFITISNVSDLNHIDFTNTKFVPETYYDRLDNKRKAHTNDILYTVVGSFGIPVFIDSDMKFTFQRHIAILRPDSKIVISKYLYYVLQSSDFLQQANAVAVGAAQKTITLSALNKMKLPLPSLEEQARIVAILDKFDALATDIANGLSAEIDARCKQYEYYRDKLLTFKELL